MVTASFYWVGSEAPVLGRRPDRWLLFDKNVPGEARVDQVLEWLQLPTGSRPHLVTLYFEFLDDRAHWNGIGSTEFLATMDRVDALIGRLRAGIATLPHGAQVNVVVVSDHGQMPYLDEPPFILDRHVDLTGLTLVEGGPYVLAWQERPDPVAANELAEQVNRSWPHGRAFTRASAPAEWHLPDSPRNPQLVFVADAGYAVLSNESMKGKVTPGDHGWAPDVPQMDGVFMATGPGIRRGAHIGPVESTDVHALLLSLLQLDPPQIKTDGGDAALQVLRREP
jgi:predicted AlkP superfamily pyrophosphatase or phosphodiesterase